MDRAIAVLNAGSSSLKFSIFIDGSGELQPLFRGQAEGLFTSPRFLVRDRAGATVAETQWPEGTRLGHAGRDRTPVPLGRRGQGESGRAAAGRGGPPHRPRRVEIPRADPDRRRGPGRSRGARPPRAAPPAAQPGPDPGPRRAPARPAAGRVLRHGVPPHPARGGPGLRPAARLHREGVRRYGFHGLSYEYIASVLPRYDARAAAGRVVVAHLGNGASLCALRDGSSVATTMGFSSLDGLPMGTRCGALDPGVLLSVRQSRHRRAGRSRPALRGIRAARRLRHLQRHAGAAGQHRPAGRRGDRPFVYRIGRELGSLAAALGGLDALVFTAGIGEHAAAIRAAGLPRRRLARASSSTRRPTRPAGRHHRERAASPRGSSRPTRN